MKKNIHYSVDHRLSVDEFIDILKRSSLAARRPIDDPQRMGRMLDAYTLHVTAWEGATIVGVATAWTDFAFTCYLADLAVDEALQHQGIGKELVAQVKAAAGPQATLILIAAPAAAQYYPKIGMERFTDCFLLRREQ